MRRIHRTIEPLTLRQRLAHGPPRRLCTTAALLAATLAAGCQNPTSGERGWSGLNPLGRLAGSGEATTPTTSSPAAASTPNEKAAAEEPLTNQLVGFVTGKKENLPRAKKLYQQADTLFRQASREPKSTRTDRFAKAAELFEQAGEEAPGSGLHQDALFMQGEALFFANDLNGARDAFETLQQEFPRNRHSDRAAARLFSIGKYWIEASRAGNDAWYKMHPIDRTLPFRDPDGHAVRVLDQIRYDDPTGKLADDATMAAAAEHIRHGRYEKADEFLTDLRETFTDSDHLFLAHLLGIRCKLEIYAGPRYSERVLDEADTLVQQTRRRFPDKLRETKYEKMLARAAAEIEYHQAEKLAFRARYRRKQREYGAARELYRKILRDHPTTPQAEVARETLEKLEPLPDSPSRPLAFLTKVFPSAKRSPPLVTVESQRGGESGSQPDGEGPGGEDGGESESTGKRLLR